MIERLKALQADKAQYPNIRVLSQSLRENKQLKKEIEALSRTFLNRTISGCNNCYQDAYFELINISIEKAMQKEKCQFILRRGALLHDVVNLDVSKNMSFLNSTDELALYHLKTNPNCVIHFSKLPENWKELVEHYQEDKKLQEVTEVKKSTQRTPRKKKSNKDSYSEIKEVTGS